MKSIIVPGWGQYSSGDYKKAFIFLYVELIALDDKADTATATEQAEKLISDPNVVGVIEGSDPELKNEFIILSAHSDHIGVSKNSVLKDKINNGAMDNASGVTTLLEIAHEFHHAKEKPKRSVIFAFVTGEEKGLLGSEYYATYPTVPIDNIVASCNFKSIQRIS